MKHNVSVFVSVEFADEDLLNLLATYGELNLHPFAASSLPKKAILTLRTAFVSFNSTRLTVIFQSVWSLGSLKIGFKYLGHPVTPHHCQSTKHVVKNCPKRCQPPPPPSPSWEWPIRARHGHFDPGSFYPTWNKVLHLGCFRLLWTT